MGEVKSRGVTGVDTRRGPRLGLSRSRTLEKKITPAAGTRPRKIAAPRGTYKRVSRPPLVPKMFHRANDELESLTYVEFGGPEASNEPRQYPRLPKAQENPLADYRDEKEGDLRRIQRATRDSQYANSLAVLKSTRLNLETDDFVEMEYAPFRNTSVRFKSSATVASDLTTPTVNNGEGPSEGVERTISMTSKPEAAPRVSPIAALRASVSGETLADRSDGSAASPTNNGNKSQSSSTSSTPKMYNLPSTTMANEDHGTIQITLTNESEKSKDADTAATPTLVLDNAIAEQFAALFACSGGASSASTEKNETSCAPINTHWL
mmetsp:Transcript_18407/g.27346  ORF Transcript_18407/g.27346 Transcript_18407/m.27346 type:complete len:322 (+) Transcript_18407:465-1430(+)